MGSKGDADPGANTEASDTIHRLELLARGLSTSSKRVHGQPVAAGPEELSLLWTCLFIPELENTHTHSY